MPLTIPNVLWLPDATLMLNASLEFDCHTAQQQLENWNLSYLFFTLYRHSLVYSCVYSAISNIQIRNGNSELDNRVKPYYVVFRVSKSDVF